MNEKLMDAFIHENKDRICCSDAYYIQYQQARDIRRAIQRDTENGSLTAATDQVIFTIGSTVLNIGCFNAEAVSAFDEALLTIMQNAVENIHLADPDMIV